MLLPEKLRHLNDINCNENPSMDIRLEIKFLFEECEYHADILMIKLSAAPLAFFYVVHLFDEELTSEFPSRYLFRTSDHRFLTVIAASERERRLIHSIQSAISSHRNYHCNVN